MADHSKTAFAKPAAKSVVVDHPGQGSPHEDDADRPLVYPPATPPPEFVPEPGPKEVDLDTSRKALEFALKHSQILQAQRLARKHPPVRNLLRQMGVVIDKSGKWPFDTGQEFPEHTHEIDELKKAADDDFDPSKHFGKETEPKKTAEPEPDEPKKPAPHTSVKTDKKRW